MEPGQTVMNFNHLRRSYWEPNKLIIKRMIWNHFPSKFQTVPALEHFLKQKWNCSMAEACRISLLPVIYVIAVEYVNE